MRRRRFALALTLIVALGVLAAREAFDPWLVLFLDDWIHPKPAPLSVQLDEGLVLRVYADTRPHIGKIDELQKGLVLVVDGRQKIEEGFGFGAPIIRYDSRTYLSRHAEIARRTIEGRPALVKRYTIDVADHASQFLREKYRDVAPLGAVVFTYTLTSPTTLAVTVDFSELAVAWDAAYLMNEQGARAFPIYQGRIDDGDALDATHTGEEVGIWRPVGDPCGCWLNREGTLRFCVETEPGRSTYIGRERYLQVHWAGIYVLSWSGVDIELTAPVTRYDYLIHIERAPDGDWAAAGGLHDASCP